MLRQRERARQEPTPQRDAWRAARSQQGILKADRHSPTTATPGDGAQRVKQPRRRATRRRPVCPSPNYRSTPPTDRKPTSLSRTSWSRLLSPRGPNRRRSTPCAATSMRLASTAGWTVRQTRRGHNVPERCLLTPGVQRVVIDPPGCRRRGPRIPNDTRAAAHRCRAAVSARRSRSTTSTSLYGRRRLSHALRPGADCGSGASPLRVDASSAWKSAGCGASGDCCWTNAIVTCGVDSGGPEPLSCRQGNRKLRAGADDRVRGRPVSTSECVSGCRLAVKRCALGPVGPPFG